MLCNLVLFCLSLSCIFSLKDVVVHLLIGLQWKVTTLTQLHKMSPIIVNFLQVHCTINTSCLSVTSTIETVVLGWLHARHELWTRVMFCRGLCGTCFTCLCLSSQWPYGQTAQTDVILTQNGRRPHLFHVALSPYPTMNFAVGISSINLCALLINTTFGMVSWK